MGAHRPECPSCRTAHAPQTRFCSSCGHRFAPEPHASASPQKRLAPMQAGCGCLALFGAVVLGVATFGHKTRANVYADTSVSRATDEHRPIATPSPSKAEVGETVTVRQANGFWPCGSTTQAFDDLMKWAVRGDNAGVRRSMNLTRSIGLNGGMSVKILDIGLGKRKVRVLSDTVGETYLRDEQGVFPADPRIGRECWVGVEALSP